MQPIHELLDRIRWDPAFGKGEFELGVYDRVDDKILRVPMREIVFVQGEHGMFHYLDEDGVEHDVPLHRIKSVYKNGERIWHRQH